MGIGLIGFLIILGVIFIRSRAPSMDLGHPADPENIKSLPYMAWTSVGVEVEKKGVVKYKKKKAFEGINLYNSGDLSEAYLLDMQGNRLHTWSLPSEGTEDWHMTKLTPNGDLLVIVKDKQLMRLGWDSKIKWVTKLRFHHDVAIDVFGFPNHIFTKPKR